MVPDTAPEIPIDRFEIYANGLDHPECLAFDRDGFLWAGGEAGQVYRISPDRSVDTIAEMGGFCGGVAWSPDDAELYVCNPQHGIVLTDDYNPVEFYDAANREDIRRGLAARHEAARAE